jgi:hypothetical protein
MELGCPLPCHLCHIPTSSQDGLLRASLAMPLKRDHTMHNSESKGLLRRSGPERNPEPLARPLLAPEHNSGGTPYAPGSPPGGGTYSGFAGIYTAR